MNKVRQYDDSRHEWDVTARNDHIRATWYAATNSASCLMKLMHDRRHLRDSSAFCTVNAKKCPTTPPQGRQDWSGCRERLDDAAKQFEVSVGTRSGCCDTRLARQDVGDDSICLRSVIFDVTKGGMTDRLVGGSRAMRYPLPESSVWSETVSRLCFLSLSSYVLYPFASALILPRTVAICAYWHSFVLTSLRRSNCRGHIGSSTTRCTLCLFNRDVWPSITISTSIF